ncbi:hypothetical protein SS50377_21387 [Spironucleus salmonicida]|uniref:Uncharacterized protein n=1 Tax=Spironucleus salmonicida TaxID=348837 RepID=V6LIT9_9EUKA|nr:hypothetical protein SS50377_21387 [Spironucleus salmonicida]|eukprot:EST44233.1 Hypothetical protein SS50377_15957 [Spironucleus salmonicida]
MFSKTLNSDQADYTNEYFLEQLTEDCNFDYKYVDGIAYIKQKYYLEFIEIKLHQVIKTFYKLLLNTTYGKIEQNVIRPSVSFDRGDFAFNKYDEQLHKDCKIQIIGQNMFKNNYSYEEQLQQAQISQSNTSFAGKINSVARTMLYTLICFVVANYHSLARKAAEVSFRKTITILSLGFRKQQNHDTFIKTQLAVLQNTQLKLTTSKLL